MILKMDEVVSIFDAASSLIEEKIDAGFAFKLASLIVALTPTREAFSMAVQKMEKDESGKLNPEDVNALCDQEIEVSIPKLMKKDLLNAFEKLPVKVLIALMPVVEDE